MQWHALCSRNINKQILNIAGENLTENSFLSRYHYTKSKNYLNDDIEIVSQTLMFIGTPCTLKIDSILSPFLDSVKLNCKFAQIFYADFLF